MPYQHRKASISLGHNVICGSTNTTQKGCTIWTKILTWLAAPATEDSATRSLHCRWRCHPLLAPTASYWLATLRGGAICCCALSYCVVVASLTSSELHMRSVVIWPLSLVSNHAWVLVATGHQHRSRSESGKVRSVEWGREWTRKRKKRCFYFEQKKIPLDAPMSA
jgi:hypothetical protein